MDNCNSQDITQIVERAELNLARIITDLTVVLGELKGLQAQVKKTCDSGGGRGNVLSPADTGVGEKLIGVKELSVVLGVDENWIYQRTRKNEIPFVKVGKYNRFCLSEVLNYLRNKGD